VFKRVEVLKRADIASLRSVTEPIFVSSPEYNALCIKKQQLEAYFFIRQCVKNIVRCPILLHDEKTTDFSHEPGGFFPKKPVFFTSFIPSQAKSSHPRMPTI
jgi:hypothetical protein